VRKEYKNVKGRELERVCVCHASVVTTGGIALVCTAEGGVRMM